MHSVDYCFSKYDSLGEPHRNSLSILLFGADNLQCRLPALCASKWRENKSMKKDLYDEGTVYS